MLTLRHIKIYKKYKGDGDGFVRCATQEEKVIMDYVHWSLIVNLVQDINLVKNGMASESYMISIEENLKKNCDSEETIQELKTLTSL